MSTIRDVARESGLSTGTISKALRFPEKVSKGNLTKIYTAIDKLGYKPNMLSQQFRNKQSNTLVALVPNLRNPFYCELIGGIERCAHSRGYEVLIAETKDLSEREKKYVRMVETRLAAGIINLRPYVNGDSSFPAEGVLAVAADNCTGTPYYSVGVDNIGAADTLVSYLISLGHVRIGVISGLFNNAHSMDRLAGYKRALQRAGIRFDESLVVEGDYSYLSGYTAVNAFAAMAQPPTAIFSMNDQMAIAAIRQLYELGIKVPEDISIVGFDDIEPAKYCIPALTTIFQPPTDIGVKATEILLDLIAGQTPEQLNYLLPYKLVVRDSTAAPKS